MPSINSKANKCYTSGDLIIKCKPIVHVIHELCKGKRCDNCYQSESLKKCSKCYQMFYCSKDCQKKDWIFHKHECGVLSTHTTQLAALDLFNPFHDSEPRPIARLLLRLLLLLKNKPSIASKQYQLSNGLRQSLDDIQIDVEIYDMNIALILFFKHLSKLFKTFGLEFGDKALFRLYCITIRFSILSDTSIPDKCDNLFPHSLASDYEPYICCGLYIPLTVYSHSCSPNSIVVLNANSIELRAIEEIETNEEITFALFEFLSPRNERQAILRDFYLYDCHCIRCETNSDQNFDFEELYAKRFVLRYLYNGNDQRSIKAYLQYNEAVIKSLEQVISRFHPLIVIAYLTQLENKLYVIHNDCQCAHHSYDSVVCIHRLEIISLTELIRKKVITLYGCDSQFHIYFEQYLIRLTTFAKLVKQFVALNFI